MNAEDILRLDQQHVWHPYNSLPNHSPMFVAESAQGVRIKLASGETLIDGMSSWWSTLHGYNHPELNRAVETQLSKMAHIMFGGFTHEPAVTLAKALVDISPAPLQHVFFSDSGSVAVEVAMKMALQYWHALGKQKSRFLTIKKGYHGDTFTAMSVCDPITGMHSLFNGVLNQQLFAEQPISRFDGQWQAQDIDSFESLLREHHGDIGGVILEPIVQGTGGMHFYHPNYLKRVRELTAEYGIPLIADEIATGLGRTGKLFACEHANIAPDIMCLGKTLSAGYITLAATLCSTEIAQTIHQSEVSVLMHGPTFMANPLACAVAKKSLDLLDKNHWQQQVAGISTLLSQHLAECKNIKAVNDVRVLGAIGVLEMHEPVDIQKLQPEFVRHGIWLRPFGKLIYMMPPYISTSEDIIALCEGLKRTLAKVY